MKKDIKKFLEVFRKKKKEIDCGKEEKEDLNKKYDLGKKQEEFLDFVEKKLPNYYTSETIKKFIDKMAIWYEFRYPDLEIENMLNENDKFLSVSGVINKSESYKDLLFFSQDETDIKNNLSNTSWSDLFDIKTFLNTLSADEKSLLKRPKFVNRYIFKDKHFSFVLSSKGTITNIYFYTNGEDNKEILNFLNRHISEFLEYLKEKKQLNDDDLHYYEAYKKSVLFKEKLLDSVMYKIIERQNGSIEGCMRAFLFALEFDRNIDIPLMYHNPLYMNNRLLYNEYIKRGGNKDLICPYGYPYQIIKETKLKDLYQNKEYDFTKEELDLYKRFYSVLSNRLENNQDLFIKELNEKDREAVKVKRIERKLEKSRNR